MVSADPCQAAGLDVQPPGSAQPLLVSVSFKTVLLKKLKIKLYCFYLQTKRREAASPALSCARAQLPGPPDVFLGPQSAGCCALHLEA